MDKNQLQKLTTIEKLQNQTLFYIRALAEALQPGKKIVPEVWLDDHDVMDVLHCSPSTLKRRRRDGVLPFKRIKRKNYYREEDVQRLLAEGGV